LTDDTRVETVNLLRQLVSISNGSQPTVTPIESSVGIPAPIIAVNLLWFISLCLSLTCALGATLVQQCQQWARTYIRATYDPNYGPVGRGRMHALFSETVRRFNMATLVQGLYGLLHIAIIMFLAGIVVFLSQRNLAITYACLGLVSATVLCYGVLTLLPVFLIDSPYRTPFTSTVWRALRPIAVIPLFFHSVYDFFYPRVKLGNTCSTQKLTLQQLGRFKQGIRDYSDIHHTRRSLDVSDIVALEKIAANSIENSTDGILAFLIGLTGLLEDHCSPTAPPLPPALTLRLSNFADSLQTQRIMLRICDLLARQWDTWVSQKSERIPYGVRSMKALWCLSYLSNRFFPAYISHFGNHALKSLSERDALPTLARSLEQLTHSPDQSVSVPARALLAPLLATIMKKWDPPEYRTKWFDFSYAFTFLASIPEDTFESSQLRAVNAPYLIVLEILSPLFLRMSDDSRIPIIVFSTLRACIDYLPQRGRPSEHLALKFMLLWDDLLAQTTTAPTFAHARYSMSKPSAVQNSVYRDNLLKILIPLRTALDSVSLDVEAGIESCSALFSSSLAFMEDDDFSTENDTGMLADFAMLDYEPVADTISATKPAGKTNISLQAVCRMLISLRSYLHATRKSDPESNQALLPAVSLYYTNHPTAVPAKRTQSSAYQVSMI
jgi:hypothetical protein